MGLEVDVSGLSPVRRQRRVIVFVDLVESVRLMQRHELDAIERWRRFAAQARDQVLPEWGGRLVRTAGDGLLVECDRVQTAIGATQALHTALADHNLGCEDDERMLLRAGIHIANVLFDDHEAYGAGVNLAQRLAGLAEPGGTVISAEVRDQLDDGVHCDISDLGPRYVKHLAEPIRAFAVAPPNDAGAAPRRRSLPPTDDLRPKVAVVPFVAMPADAEHDAIGHALADDIIATLARHPGLRVLSRMTTAAVREIADLTRLRDLLGATFVLSGRFYVRGRRVRLAAELTELREGQVLWTAVHHADVDALFEGQDDLVPQLVAQVSEQVLAHELVRVRSLPMSSLASYSLYLGAGGLLNSFVPSDFERARDLLIHLAERHPRQAVPQAMLANWHFFRVLQGWTQDGERETQFLHAHARRALDLDPQLPDAHLVDGIGQIFASRDFDAAQRCFERALDLNPQHPMAWARLSETQRIAGDLETALDSAERAIALSPLDPQRFIFESFAASAALEAHRFDEAQRHARSSLRRHMLFAPPHRVLICALWLDGQRDAARVAAQECLRCIPGLTVGGRIAPTRGPPALDTPYAQALLAAGIPA